MRLLLDTHTFIWWDIEPDRLSPRALMLCQDPQNQLILSVASVWEMEIKTQLGKLHFDKPLPIMLAHALAIGALPLVHRDPFDRLLIAQAKVESIPIISRDENFTAYPVTVEW